MEKYSDLKGPLWDVKSPNDLIAILRAAYGPMTHAELTKELAKDIGIDETEIANDVGDFLETACMQSILRPVKNGYVVRGEDEDADEAEAEAEADGSSSD